MEQRNGTEKTRNKEKRTTKLLEPQLRPEFIAEMKKRQKEPTVKVKDFRKHFKLK